MTKILRYFGRKQDIDRVLTEMGLEEICSVTGGEDMDNKVLLPDFIGDEDYYELCERLEEGLYAEQDEYHADL